MGKVMTNREKRQKKYGLFAMSRYMIALGLQKKPLLMPLLFLSFIGMGVSATINTLMKQIFFEAIENLVKGRELFARVLVYGILVSLFPLFIYLLKMAASVVSRTFFETAQGYMGIQLNEKAARVDPLVYEDNRFLDHINKAYRGLEAVWQVVEGLIYVVLNQVVYLLSMAVYLYTVKPALLLMFFASFLPNIIGTVVHKRMYARREHKAAPYRRRYEYFEKCLSGREYVKETRLWRAEGFFKRLYSRNLWEYARLDWQTARHTLLVNLGLRFLTLTGYVGIIVMLFYYMFKGEVGVGAFAAIFTSLDNLFSQIIELFDGQIGYISRDLGAAENYFDFLALPERQGSEDILLQRECMEFRDVSFTYPGSDRPALQNIDLTVHKGETIAIVGVNGSGKSTLTRLLTGLYLPTSGELLIDGKNVSEIAPEALYRNVSAVFQRYQSYKMTVAENVRISETEKGARNAENQADVRSGNGVAGNAVGRRKNVVAGEAETAGKEFEKEAAGRLGTAVNEPEEAIADSAETDVRAALQEADFPTDSEKLTEGLETMLGKDFGGIDLSGGQWQRLAIARGLYRAHDMIVLDEPTAAIDPLEEADIYRKFAEISKDKTAFIVTHRLGSAQIADWIIVMDAGRIVDMGTHEELMQREGKYQEMYHAQAKWYM